MNGVHDMGGRHGFGPVKAEAFEALILAQGLVTGDELMGRAAEYGSLERDPVF